MANKILFKNARIVNELTIQELDVLVHNDRIDRIDREINDPNALIIDCQGQFLCPGIIDDQVHFREPGLTHKATIWSESRAAVAGGVTSFMEMPNTQPPALTRHLLEEKYEIGKLSSIANYSFFIGASEEYMDEVFRIDPKMVCGIKVFMGSSTGNLLVDNPASLEKLFSEAHCLIASHCEDEATIRRNVQLAKERFGDDVPVGEHPAIRSREACYISSSLGIKLAKQYGTRFHVLHISTADELELFNADELHYGKQITSELCVHHMYFNDADYAKKGNLIKCNPAIKTSKDNQALAHALKNGVIDIIATDHAPHTFAEKQLPYLQAPAGLPLVQHGFNMMLELGERYQWDISFVVQKMSHAPADCFAVKERGYLREGYYADLFLFNPDSNYVVNHENILYQCEWSPLEGKEMQGRISQTFVNGNCVYKDGKICEGVNGRRLSFDR